MKHIRRISAARAEMTMSTTDFIYAVCRAISEFTYAKKNETISA